VIQVTVRNSSLLRALSAAALTLAAASPSPTVTWCPRPSIPSLKQVGKDWLPKNPYLGNKEAIRIGDSAFNQNCARCHGLGAVSGGIAPDLRYLPPARKATRSSCSASARAPPATAALHAPVRRHPEPGSHVDHPRLAGDRP
jgi:mono/diheme cytochrome c family protein